MDGVIPRSLFNEAIFDWLICMSCFLISRQCVSLFLFVWLYSVTGDLPSIPRLIGLPTKDWSPPPNVQTLERQILTIPLLIEEENHNRERALLTETTFCGRPNFLLLQCGETGSRHKKGS
jgi:hypothetical protein